MAAPVSGRSEPGRRVVLASGALGIFTTALPSSVAAASPDPEAEGLTAPTGVAAIPRGYLSDGSTGAIRVSWGAVQGATGYEVDVTVGGVTETTTVVGYATNSLDVSGLAGEDTTHTVVVRAVTDSDTSLDSPTVTASPVIGVGGTVTLLPSTGTPTDVVHTFAYDEEPQSFLLRRDIELQYLLVGGGGGGGGGDYPTYVRAGGGGGGGGVAVGTLTASKGTFTAAVGAGGAGQESEASTERAESGGTTTLSFADGSVTASGGVGGGRGRRVNNDDNPWGGSGGASGAPTSFAAGQRPDLHGAGGGGASSEGSPSVAEVDGATGGGDGGDGASSSLSGATEVYGGGGGGGSPDGTAGTGGTGGGGTGGANNTAGSAVTGASNGADGRGGGGGGGNSGVNSTPTTRQGAPGGHGVVVLRYALP
mgnify:CR=1 FL=1